MTCRWREALQCNKYSIRGVKGEHNHQRSIADFTGRFLALFDGSGDGYERSQEEAGR